ncbi:MAG: hypothetical protein D6736_02605 [Nitrospinota bacterium]|nr:MAG: hypothetical protein D6736_02605 [Nitrospinota bacterium]
MRSFSAPQGFCKMSSLLLPLLPYLLYLIAVVYFLSFSPYSLYDFPLDDAWIHRVYSRSFALGQGFAYNPGQQEAGSTSPLWAIVTAPAHWLEPFGTRSVVVAVKEIGILLGILLIRELVLLTCMLTRSWKSALVAGSLFALEPRFLFSTLSGMETILLLVLWLSATRAYVQRRWVLSALLMSLMPVTRPEALLLLPLWWGGMLLLPSSERPQLKALLSGVILALPMGLWSLFCRLTNGHWLPNTFYLKARGFQIGPDDLRIAWEVLSQHGYAILPLFWVGLIVYILWTFQHRRFSVQVGFLYLLFAPVLYGIGVLGSRTMTTYGYYWTRWFDPVSLLLTVAFSIGYGLFVHWGMALVKAYRCKRQRKRSTVLLGGLGWVALLALLAGAPIFVHSFSERRLHFATDARAIHLINVRTGQWINQHTPETARVGVNDAGAIRYFGRRWTLDLIGLNNADIAFGRKTARQLIEEDSIDWLAIFPSWFQGSSIWQGFVPRQVFQIPLAEYTICPCPGQTRMVIFERRAGAKEAMGSNR